MNSSKSENLKLSEEIKSIKNDVKIAFNKKRLKIHIPTTKVHLKCDDNFDEDEPKIKHREVEFNIS